MSSNRPQGGGSSSAKKIVITDESTDTSCNVLYATDATGKILPKTGDNLTFNSNTGVLTATGFAGPITGNVTGNTSGSSGSTTGNAATVTTNANLTGDVTSSGNATTIATDAVDIAMLSASGTASSGTFLRGDNAWAAAGGDYEHGATTYALQGSAPSDPATDKGVMYMKDIDSNNEGLFMKVKKNGAVVEVQIL